MRPVCLLDRAKNLYQSDRLHFISDSLKIQMEIRTQKEPPHKACVCLVQQLRPPESR